MALQVPLDRVLPNQLGGVASIVDDHEVPADGGPLDQHLLGEIVVVNEEVAAHERGTTLPGSSTWRTRRNQTYCKAPCNTCNHDVVINGASAYKDDWAERSGTAPVDDDVAADGAPHRPYRPRCLTSDISSNGAVEEEQRPPLQDGPVS